MLNDLTAAFIPGTLYSRSSPSNEEFLISLLQTIDQLSGHVPANRIDHLDGSVEIEDAYPVMPEGQVPISEAAYLYLTTIHQVTTFKSMRMHYVDDDRRSSQERDLWILLNEHRKNNQHYVIHLTGQPGYQYPTHPRLGALYAGDDITMLNRCFLIHRKSGTSNKLHAGKHEPGYYLLALKD